MIQPPPDWQTRRAQARANALSLLESDPSAAGAQATISEVVKDLASNVSEAAEDSFTQAGSASSIANRLHESRLTDWATAFESLVNHAPGLEPRACAVEIIIGRAAGLLCGTSPGERAFTFVRHLRDIISFESSDFVPAAEQALKSDTGRINALAAMLSQRAATFETEPRRSVSLSDRELAQLSHEQSWETRFIDVWDDHLNRAMIFLHDFDAYELLRRTDYSVYLNLLEDFPSRGFPYQLLDFAYEWATTSELCFLLKNSRTVFYQNGAWIKQGRVAFIVLNLLAYRLLQPIESGPPSETFKTTLAEIINALMARPDATPLGYAWLQRVLMSPGRCRRRSTMKDDANLREALLLVAQNLAPHLAPHPDPLTWIEAELYVWRNWRIYPLLAIELYRRPMNNTAIADLIAQTSLRDLPSSVGLEGLGQSTNIERTVISFAVAKIPDLANWFSDLWKRLFWQRNRFRWLRQHDATRPNIGQVIVLWGLCGLELLPATSNEARSLWLAVYDAVRESILMDAFRQPNDAWSIALRFLGALWPKTFPDDPPAGTPGSLEDLVGPWRHSDADFAHLVDVLDRYGVQPEQLRRAGVSGDMLRRIVDDSHVRGRTVLQPQEISAINAVAAKLDETMS